MSTMTVASNPTAFYIARRESGDGDRLATERVCHAYGRTAKDLAGPLARGRAQWEALQAEPEPLDQAPDLDRVPADPWDLELGQLAEAKADLEGQLPSLSLAARNGDQAAAKALGKVEAEVARLERDAQRVRLAREQDGQDAEREAREERRRAIDRALRRAAELGADRVEAAKRVDAALLAAATVLAEHQAMAHHQFVALGEADPNVRPRQVFPDGDALAAAFAFALQRAEAPAGWVELPLNVIRHAGPLAESDPRPCEPLTSSTETTKGK